MPKVDGDFVHIPPDMDIFIDENTPNLGGIFIEGTLGFLENSGNLELNAAYILVTGDLLVGCRTTNGLVTEFSSKATITLIEPERYGADITWPDHGVRWGALDIDPILGGTPNYQGIKDACLDRGLVVTRAGRLMIYGKDKGVSWTQLDATASVNDTQITLIDDPTGGWKDGDSVIIASTDFEYPDPHPQLSGRPSNEWAI